VSCASVGECCLARSVSRIAHACLCSITATEIKRHHAYLDKEMEKMLKHKELAEEVAKKVSQQIIKGARRD
jgi:hypothetical protein